MTDQPALPVSFKAAYDADDENATPELQTPDDDTSLDPLIEDCGIREIDCDRPYVAAFWCQNDGQFHAYQILCKRWTCPYCGRVKRAKLQADIKAARPNRFITLTTCGSETETPRQIFDWTRRQISELAKVIRREHGEFEYLRCLEATQRGFPHYHLLVRSKYLDQRELSHRWCNFTRAYIVDIRSLTKDEKAANYVMKYLTKQNAIAFTQRRLSWTRRFFPPAPPADKPHHCPIEITRWPGTLESYAYWEMPGTQWEKLNRWHWIRRSPT